MLRLLRKTPVNKSLNSRSICAYWIDQQSLLAVDKIKYFVSNIVVVIATSPHQCPEIFIVLI
jgi:hypothetical protein